MCVHLVIFLSGVGGVCSSEADNGADVQFEIHNFSCVSWHCHGYLPTNSKKNREVTGCGCVKNEEKKTEHNASTCLSISPKNSSSNTHLFSLLSFPVDPVHLPSKKVTSIISWSPLCRCVPDKKLEASQFRRVQRERRHVP